MYYYRQITVNNIIYSLDMIRLNFEFKRDGQLEFDELLESYAYIVEFKINRYLSKGIGYRYLYNICIDGDDKCSFAIGIGLNSLSENKDKGFIEFNPNKCMCNSLFVSFIDKFFKLCYSALVVRYDCAIDLPIARSKVKMIRDQLCNYENLNIGYVISNSVTEYQGRRNHNKFCKLYDKKAEANLDYDLTRIEYTFDRDEVCFNNLPQFFIYDEKLNPGFDFSLLRQNDIVFVDLLRNSPEVNLYLNNLTYRFRKKINPFLFDCNFKVDFNIVKKIRQFALKFEI